MFSTLITIMRGRSERAREGIEAANAALIIEQKIREAERGHDRAKRSLAALILRERNETRALSGLKARRKDLEDRTRQALAASMDALSKEGAQAVADLCNEETTREDALDRTRLAVERLRLMVEKSERRLVDLRQGLITARAMEAERDGLRETRTDFAGAAAISEGEAVLARVLDGADPVAEMDILDEINDGLSGDALVDRMAKEGFGDARRTRPEDVLERLRKTAGDTSETAA